VPKDDEVLIGTKACGVNFPDGSLLKTSTSFGRRARFLPVAKWPGSWKASEKVYRDSAGVTG
jgi:NADPH:quinone reductase-like Zn-dependent oxidoreductase